MSQSDLDQTLDLLSADDAATRRNAAKRLGELKRPEAIPRLATLYANDEDESVRRAAADALRVFRAMEQASSGRDSSATPAATSGGLGRVRGLLTLVLALTIFVNVALVVSRLLPTGPSVPQQATPTPRGDLVKAYAARINDVRRDTTALRAVFTGLEGLGIEALKLNKAQCDQLKTSQVNIVEMGNLDALNYPDLRDANDAINKAAANDFTMRNTLNTICSLTSGDDLKNQLSQLGGAASLVAKVDAITNQDLANASALLKKAIDSPIPTITPTYTPSNTDTPTITNTPKASNTPTPLPPTNTPAASNTGQPPTSTPTQAVSPTVTAIPSTTFKGLKLDALKSYVLKNVTTIDVKLTGNKTGHATSTVIINRQTSPLTGSYDVTIANSNVPAALLKSFGAYGIVGVSDYVFIDGTMYQTGAIAKLARPATTCQQINIPDDTGLLKVFANPPSSDLALKTVGDDGINSVNTRHYHGEETNGNVVHDIDLWVSTDSRQQPIRLIDKAVTTATKSNPIGSNVLTETVVTQIDLTGIDQPVTIAEQLACNKS